MPVYARDTEVPADRSRAEIERTLQRYGASAFMYGWDVGRAVIGFEIAGRRYRVALPLPDRKDFRYTETRRQRRSENARLRTRIKDVEKDRDSWKSEWEMWSKAWMREIGKVFPKTHMIDSLVLTTRWMRETLEFHPRATKLMSKRKNFLVVAEDEHYFAYVYRIIRGSEKAKGNWTAEDERLYQCAISRAALQSLNADVSVETQEESSR